MNHKAFLSTMFKAGGYKIPVRLAVIKDRLWFDFDYNETLIKVIKNNFSGRKWSPSETMWHAPINQRNMFRLKVLMGEDLYGPWDINTDYKESITAHCANRRVPTTPFPHQYDMINMSLNVKKCIWAAEMGTGKTLAALLLCELLIEMGFCTAADIWWFGPLSALAAVEHDFDKWQASFRPVFSTYDRARRTVEEWKAGKPAPKIIICDESSRLKTATAKRTIAMRHITDSMRDDHKGDCYIVLMSGTPAPKSPIDWWSQLEIVQPGFLSEGHPMALRDRLAVTEKRESATGQLYPHLIGWRDDAGKCNICYKKKDHANHKADTNNHQRTWTLHTFEPSINEVDKLRVRMKGAVEVWFKKDCIKLPPKRFEVREVAPTVAQMNAAKSAVQSCARKVDLLTQLRTISDGFQYRDKVIGKETCPMCSGSGKVKDYVGVERDFSDESINNSSEVQLELEFADVPCGRCVDGEVDITERETFEIGTPKDTILISLLEEHSEIGRLNVYAGFQGSIDRIKRICLSQGWSTIRADGRGWEGTAWDGTELDLDKKELLQMYDKTVRRDYDEQVVFIGQPGAAGMGLTLTASPTTFFFSNTYSSEDRQQTMDRGHRPGMRDDGGLIVDAVCLPTDRQVLENLTKKRDLELMTLTEIKGLYE